MGILTPMKPAFIITILLSVSIISFAEAQRVSTTPAAAAPSASVTALSSQSAPTTEYTLPPDKLAKSKALYEISGRMRTVGTIWGFVVLLGILYLGVVARFRDWAERASKYSFPQALIAVPLFVIVVSVLDWPLSAYGHHISLQYGLSVQHWGSWFGDVLKGLGISIFFSIIILWFLIWRIRRSPRWWWLQVWLAALPFIVFV